MRLLTGLSMVALMALAAPALAQETPAAPATEAPAAPAAPEAPAAAPAAPVAKTPAPEGVSDEIDKTLWCGHAFSEVAVQAKAGGDANTANQMAPFGEKLILDGVTALTQGGVAEARIAEIKTAYASQISTELAGNGDAAKFTFQDCIALVQPPAPPAAPEAPAVAPAEPAAPAAQ